MERNNTYYMTGVEKDIYVKWPAFMTPYDKDAINYGDVISWCKLILAYSTLILSSICVF